MEPAAYSIDEFCRAHAISRGMFYKMAHEGKAPKLMSVGTHKRISKESAADWRREREAEAMLEAAPQPAPKPQPTAGRRRKAASEDRPQTT